MSAQLELGVAELDDLAVRETEDGNPLREAENRPFCLFMTVDNRPICLYCQDVPKKARKRAKTSDIGVRDRLLDAADRLFYQEGVRAVGIKDREFRTG